MSVDRSPATHKGQNTADGAGVTVASRFDHTYCSQCGTDLGPGDEGVSSCCEHGCCPVEARGDTCECGRTPAEKGKR